MATSATTKKYTTMADALDRVGDVPANRVLWTPLPGTATEQDLLDTSVTGGRFCELVDGILVEKPMCWREGRIGLRIGRRIDTFLDDHNLGVVAGADGPIRFRLGLVRMPDVSFIRWGSVDDPEQVEEPDGAFLEFPPDLAVEVLSENNTRKEMAIKLAEYAKAGVRLVWYVDPERKEVDVYPRAKEAVRKTIGIDGVLDGGTILPGFRLPVKDIFASLAPARKGKKKGGK
jgi:Uma2 family endonuclease